mmetsp:Transcript_2303/g.7740  ORF Transcript_2303/g.7740 Transcript_2303/m.7740 type:complete len:500 (+) Transcript_2303:271-1770(+)
MHEDVLWLLLPRLGARAVPDAQPPRLVIRAVRGAGDFPIPLHPWHPGLYVELPVRGSPEVVAGHVHHLKVQPELLEHLDLDVDELLVQLIALLRRAHHEHLHLAELVDPVQPLGRRPSSASLRPEAPAEPRHLKGEGVLLEQRVHHRPSQRDLRSASQAQVRVPHPVVLGVLGPGLKPTLLQDLRPHEVGGDHRHEPPRYGLAHAVVHECQLQQRGLVPEVVELAPSHARGRLEVDEVQGLPELEVVPRLEAEFRPAAHGLQQGRALLATHRDVRVGHVGNLLPLPLQLHLNLLHGPLERRDLLLEGLSVADEHVPLLLGHLALELLGVGVPGLLQLRQLLVPLKVLGVELSHQARVRGVVPVPAVRLHLLHVVADELEVQRGLPHSGLLGLRAVAAPRDYAGLGGGLGDGRPASPRPRRRVLGLVVVVVARAPVHPTEVPEARGASAHEGDLRPPAAGSQAKRRTHLLFRPQAQRAQALRAEQHRAVPEPCTTPLEFL